MVEKEYIERETAIDCLMGILDKPHHAEFLYTDEICGTLNSIHAADVRCVVTCGECEFWNGERISCEGLARCNTGESGIRYRNRDDFCSRGKKREES